MFWKRRKRRKSESPPSEFVGDVADGILLNEMINPGSTVNALDSVVDAAGAVGDVVVEAATDING